MTARSSMRETILISWPQRGHISGSASRPFLMSSRHFADGMRRGGFIRRVDMQREIAKRFGVGTGKSVSHQLRGLSEALAVDTSLCRLVKTVEPEVVAECFTSKH